MASAREAAEKAVEKAVEKAAQKKRVPIDSLQSVFKTEAEAIREAAQRVNGPKRAFVVKVTKTVPTGDYFVLAHNPHEACTPLLKQSFGAEVVEIGKAPRAIKSKSELTKLTDMTPEHRAEAARAMTPERKAELKKQAEELLKLLK